MIAALYVREGGPYFDIPHVDPWGAERDARNYRGPWPVVAHPPCQRWGKFYAGSPKVIKETGVRKKLGDDGGCFEHAIWAARTFGGVVEHPLGSKALEAYGVAYPPSKGGWVETEDGHNGYVCCVEQKPYGHYARKPTYLIVYGVDRGCLPELQWGMTRWEVPQELIDRYGEKRARRIGEMSFKGGGVDSPIRIDTPEPFKMLLIGIAWMAFERTTE